MKSTRDTQVQNMQVEQLVTTIIASYRTDPVDFSNSGKPDGEIRYLNTMKHTYVRTISDILGLVADKPYAKISVLEIGTLASHKGMEFA